MNNNCAGCGGQNPSYSPPPIVPCHTCGNCGEINAADVSYTGSALLCTAAGTNKKLDEILQLFDEYICTAVGTDWSGFNYNCVDDDVDITTAGEFVDAMTSQFCDLLTNYNTFVGTTFPNQVTTTNNLINAITHPALTLCAGSGVINTDTLNQILAKLATKICDTLNFIDISDVDWDEHFTVPTPPTNNEEAFQLILDLIYQVQQEGGTTVLPTFNNIGTCLATPGATDSLVATINKIKTRLCQSIVYTIDDDMWTCLDVPTTFQEAFDSIVVSNNDILSRMPTFDPDVFEVTDNGCDGVNVTLQSGALGTDRLVAATSGDASPGVLADKLAAGSNITLSTGAVAGKVQINATFTDQSVKVNASDSTAGYLANKLLGATADGVTITPAANVGNDHLVLTPSLDMNVVADNFFTLVENDPDFYARFCTLICGCKPCNDPENPVPPTLKRVRLRVVNNNPSVSYTNDYTLTQKSPVLGWVNSTIQLDPGQTYESGWYDVTSTNNPLVSQFNISSATPQNLNIRVLQPNNSLVPGASGFVGALGAGYSNSAFSLGSLTTDMTVEVQLS